MGSKRTLRLGVVQQSIEVGLEASRDKVVGFLQQAAAEGCRAVVFPEDAISQSSATDAAVDACVADISREAAARDLWVVLPMLYQNEAGDTVWRLLVLSPQGEITHTYDGVWIDPRAKKAPGLFHIDDIPCAATLCADRWARGIEELPAIAGARILFECSNNYSNEWVPTLGWYWYVPRALRNGVYVVYANTPPDRIPMGGHGHTAVIAPDGSVLANADEDSDRLLVVDLDLAQATRANAVRRREHPLFRQFWEVGVKLLNGEDVECPSFTPLRSPEQEVKVAAAQFAPSRSVEHNLARMEDMIREAASNGADLVTFPELAVTGAAQSDVEAATEETIASALARIQQAAREQRATVVFGMPAFEGGRRQNCAFAVGPEGELLTRYAQIVVDRPALFSPGLSTRAMWFQVKGSWAAMTVGGDGLWSEMAELAAVRGAQIHCHLAHDPDQTAAAALRRRQLWVNLASFHTLTVTVATACPDRLPDRSLPGSGESIIWEDFHRAIQGGHGGFAPYSAYPAACAGRGEEIIYAARQLPAVNPQFEDMTGRVTPQMKPWYAAGALAMDAEA